MPLRANARCLRCMFFVGTDYQNKGGLIGISYSRTGINFVYNDGDFYSSDSNNNGVIITKPNSYSMDVTFKNNVSENGEGKNIIMDIYFS